MNTYKVLTISIVAALVVSIGILYVSPVKTTREIIEKFGAIPGNVLDHTCFTYGDVTRCSFARSLTATSSHLCSILNPVSATSTIESYGLLITRGVVGANQFEISTSTAAYGTSTTALMAVSIPTGASGTFAGRPNTSTSTISINTLGVSILPELERSGNGVTGVTNYILGPTQYVNFRLATSTYNGTFASPYLGTCYLELQKLSNVGIR